jgi:hypothetical protein
VLLLALKTGWSRREILSLRTHEFLYYVNQLAQVLKDE